MTQVADERQKYVGNGVLRKEDPDLITGHGHFVDDLTVPGMVWAAMVRSPVAHANIRTIDKSAAEAMPGVLAVLTGEDMAGDWASGLPCAWPIEARRHYPAPATEAARLPDHPPLARGKVRFAGEAVAVVVADTREHAADAVEGVDVDYDELPVVVDMEKALEPGAPLVHDELGTNEMYIWRYTAGEDADPIFASAPVVVKERYLQPRLIPNAIEPRSILVAPSHTHGDYTIWSTTQIPHFLQLFMALMCGIPESKLRVIAPNVGGGFGSKLNIYAEEAVVTALAKRLGVPVKWTEERTEGYTATIQGRSQVQHMELAATEEGKLLAVRVRLTADLGAYCQLVGPGIPLLGAFIFNGPYTCRAYDFETRAAFTNLTPTDAYRGAGRPEATYAIERAMDTLAKRVGKDPVEIRRMNFMPKFLEATTASGGLNFDSGDYEAQLDKALEMLDYDGLRREQSERRARGDSRQLGIGISTYIEMCGLAPSQVLNSLSYAGGGWDAATIRMMPTGKVEAIIGTSPHGQGHYTTFAQIVADDLGVDFDDVEVLAGDTAIAAKGLDTYGSRSVSVGGVAVHQAALKLRDKAKKIAAHELEVAEDDLEWTNGRFQVKGAPDKSKTVGELAFSAWTAHNLPPGMEPVLDGDAAYDPPNFTFPSGAHLCAVEVDTETGQTFIRKYVAVDDCGTMINPVIVSGQVHGGVAQGIAEAQWEEAIYDDNGVLLTGSMNTYRVPAASELPPFELDHTETPSSTNALGVKGIGEAGTIASPPAFVGAVLDALSPLGITHIEKPCTPERVWRAIQEAAGRAVGESDISGGVGSGSSPTPLPDGEGSAQ